MSQDPESEVAALRDRLAACQKALDEARDREQLLQLAFRANPNIVAISQAETGRFVEVSDGFCETIGFERHEVIGRSSLEFELFADPEQRLQVLATVKETGRAQNVEVAVRTRDGQIRNGLFSVDLIDIHGAPYLLTIMQDMTDQLRVERDLRVKDRALESAIFGIGMTDLEARVTYVNHAILQMWGFDSKDELLGRALPEFFEGDGVYRTMEALSAGEGISGEDLGKRKDGSVFPVQFSASVIKDQGGLPLCTFGSFVDITARKKAEEERLALEVQIQNTQKLESLGVLAGGIAHDFNNLLMGVLGNADVALTDLAPESPLRKQLEDIITAARRAADLAKQMLAYAGRGKFVVEILDLEAVIGEMTHLLEVSIATGVELKFEFGQEVPPIQGEATQIRQIVMNLVTNASEAIDDGGGTVSISTGVVYCDQAELAGTYLNDNLAPGPYSYFEVKDTGSGMDEQTQSKMFDPFFTTKFTGRGLGLAAVLGIVRGHEGAVKISSAVDEGTAVRIFLPAHQGAVKSTEERSTELLTPGGGTVLLVDDEAGVRSVAKMMLERLGFQVLTASNGREALSVFKTDPERFCCVLLDLTMPEMNGEQCLGELQRIDENARVILTSGYSEQEVTSRFAGKGLAGFIQKPFRLGSLTAVLEACLKPK
jgi:PAS domain S-box-containing protein